MIELEIVACPRCAQSASEAMVRGRDYLHNIAGEFTAARCVTCGLWYQNPRPRMADAGCLYPPSYLPYQKPVVPRLDHDLVEYLRVAKGYRDLHADELRSGRLPDRLRRRMTSWRACVGLIPVFVPGGRVLEIGCASGARLLYLQRLGWEHVDAIELSSGASEVARSLGFSVECGAVEEVLEAWPDGSFDVIVSSMVIEHLVNPFYIVDRIARKLKPGGQFLFSTVVRDALDAWLYPQFWSGYDFPRHMVYFHSRDVRRMLAPSFEGVCMCRQSAPLDFIRSATWHQAVWPRSLLDSVVSNIAESRHGKVIGMLLARSGLTCRLSVQCRRR